ncbi:Hpt domain-containing protein [Rhodoferax sp.]|uniref:hybrid sensor histidine kinase/response regulator n=1 Tax=Rhodoferax sp. TaxID=50421 RepID=UPI00374D382B
MQATESTAVDLPEQDLGPLAWVLDELRKTLDTAVKALKRYVREADAAQGAGFAVPDTSHLRIALQQLHLTVGALEMVDMMPPSLVLRAMEAAVQKFVENPSLCVEESVGKLERASFALVDYLEGVLASKPVSSVGLFPQYREVQALAGVTQVHPADLWPMENRWRDIALAMPVAPLAYSPAQRARLDQCVLKLVKTGDPVAAHELVATSLGFASAQQEQPAQVFWTIAAAYFEALSMGLFPSDVYSKRIASRVLTQYAALAKGDGTVAPRLVQDMLFFCAQAVPVQASDAPTLAAVRQAYGLQRHAPIDYEVRQFGRFDPALLAQARKRLAAAAETWSALAGGDTHRFKPALDQFTMVGESLTKLHPGSAVLAQALTQAVENTVRSKAPPSAALGMEVATSVLYLEAAFEELDQADAQLAERAGLLAERLIGVGQGAQPEPLAPWMEELYHRVSDRQTMGSVVDELRSTLGEVEQSLDQFFRTPREKVPLAKVTSQLSQMRGVLSVLGLDQASHAVMRMRETVDGYMSDDLVDDAARAASFDRLGNSLGALGFMIDMLGYQRALAKKLFVYDEEAGEFKLVMGRSTVSAQDSVQAPFLDSLVERAMQESSATGVETVTAPAETPESLELPEIEPAAAVSDAAVAEPEHFTDADMLADLAALDLSEFESESISETAPAAIEVSEPLSVMVAPEPQPEFTMEVEAPGPDMGRITEVTGDALDAEVPAPATITPSVDEDAELRDIFLEEAREVVQTGLEAVAALVAAPASVGPQSMLRRAFHTLKGSARMVGLVEFGEAGWAMEQLINGWLAEQTPASPALLGLSHDALEAFGRWVEDIAAGAAEPWRAQPFRASADALRLELRSEPLRVPQAATEADAPSELELAELGLLDAGDAEPEVDFADTTVADDADTVPGDLGDPVEVLELSDIFDLPDVPAVPEVLELPEPLAELVAADELTEVVELPEPVEAAAPAALPENDDTIKVIGSLRIGIPLYNVYLNEADEWSRRLLTELSEWSLELHQPLPDSTVSLAHSLAGSSATVGFQALSQMARALESALEHVQLGAGGTARHAQIFTDAAEDIRRLLHQFAAGFLKEPNPSVLQALRDLLEGESVAPAVVHSAEEPLQDEEALAFFDMDTVEPAVPAELVDTVAPVVQETTPEPVAQAAAEPVLPVAVEEPVALLLPAALSDFDDEMDVVDVIDADLFPIFEEEATELLPQLGGALRQWWARPDNMGARNEVLRALHTLKGSARLAGALRLGELAHRLETEIEHLGSEPLQSVQIEPLLSYFDALQADLDGLRLTHLRSQNAAAAKPEVAAPAKDGTTVVKLPTAATPEPAASMPPPRQMSHQSVRVRSQLLDRLVNQAGEVIITRTRLEARLNQLRGSLTDLTGNLERMRSHLRDIEVQAESQMQSRLALVKDTAQGFDPLEFDRFTRVQELTRMMAESVNDVATVQRNLQRTIEGTEDDLVTQARQARELQRDLLRTRMVEFEGIAERLYAVVRQASKDTGKQIKLDITGGSIEMDRGVLDRMAPAFEHLLRNAVAHGIESPEVRTAAGKPAAGSITVELHHEGNDISVRFADDGAGLDMARIRQKAVAQGLVPADQELDAAAVADMIFLPGFSTAAQVTELAGRGIGMDVVRAEVLALGGRIETASQPGQGTQFKLVLPLTTAVTQVVMLRAGSLSIGVPANVIEVVRRMPQAELEQAYQNHTVEFAGESVPFFWSGALLQVSQRSVEPAAKNSAVVIFRSASQRLALHVDEVLGNQEVVVKNLGPQLSRLPGLAGMSVLASGAVVLIYNPVALSSVYGAQARQWQDGSGATPGAPMVAAQLTPLVLVVDDSITVRRVTQRLLQREGYRVTLANDGLQALERLRDETPALVLSDIEMPRMDGFDLARNIRADAVFKDLPIIMITSRMAEKHHEHALALGVNHYLGKPYPEEELLSLVRRYTAKTEDVLSL